MEENKDISPEQPPGTIPKAPPTTTPPVVEQTTPSQQKILPEKEQEQISPADEIETPVTQQPQTSNPVRTAVQPSGLKPETKEMEVHHHGHVHEKKKWKEYLFQFLMLFLAVFCGFLAEYQLEHTIEKDREKQFIRSLAFDIKADTISLSNIISTRTIRDFRLDSLSLLMNSPSPEEYSKDIYFYAVTASRTRVIRFVPNDGTLQQLKNSGAFRLIRSREVADSIAKYDVNVRNLIRQQEVEETQIHDYRGAAAKMFNALYFEQMIDDDVNPTRLLKENPPLLAYQKTDLETWNYRLYGMKTISKANRRDARLLLRQAKELLSILNKQYHLE